MVHTLRYIFASSCFIDHFQATCHVHGLLGEPNPSFGLFTSKSYASIPGPGVVESRVAILTNAQFPLNELSSPIQSLQDRKPQASMPRLGHKAFGEIRLNSPGALSSHELSGADFKGTDSGVRPQLYHCADMATGFTSLSILPCQEPSSTELWCEYKTLNA